MTEVELKLMLLRYNILSKEKATAVHMFVYTSKSSYDDKWEECVDEMMQMMNDLRSCGYKFTCAGSREAGRVIYEIYKIVPVSNH